MIQVFFSQMIHFIHCWVWHFRWLRVVPKRMRHSQSEPFDIGDTGSQNGGQTKSIILLSSWPFWWWILPVNIWHRPFLVAQKSPGTAFEWMHAIPMWAREPSPTARPWRLSNEPSYGLKNHHQLCYWALFGAHFVTFRMHFKMIFQ